jgi:GH25 family lysozyme M1 (1,4-beta-N-acetylmuramidase)
MTRNLSRLLLAAVAAIALTPATAAMAAEEPAPTDDGGYAGVGHPAEGSPRSDYGKTQPIGYPINGIDVSSHDHSGGKTLNWPTLAGSMEFAYVKATEGTTYTNPYFAADNRDAKAAGLYVGAYAFGRPDLGNPVGQADHFVDSMAFTHDGQTLPPFLDMEWPYSSLGLPTCYGLSTSAMNSWMQSFLSRVESRTGVVPMIYTNVNWWNPCTGNSAAFSHYLLDIASCNTSAPSVPGWGTNWTFWQYNIPDCDSTLTHDSNVYRGTRAQLAALAGNNTAAALTGTLVDLNGDGKVDVVSRDTSGNLWLYPNTGGSGNLTFGTPSKVGIGWNSMTAINFADINGDHRPDVIGRDAAGDLWLYPHTGGTGTSTFGASSKVGTGWNVMTAINFADVNGDGKTDVTGRNAAGDLWLYPNTGGTGNLTFGTPSKVGIGWNSMTAINLADINGDGKTDLIGRDTAGDHWLYPNTGGTGTSTFGTRTQIGEGWNAMTAITFGDLNSDNRTDIISRDAAGDLWLYPNTGGTGMTTYNAARSQIGEGWNVMTDID